MGEVNGEIGAGVEVDVTSKKEEEEDERIGGLGG